MQSRFVLPILSALFLIVQSGLKAEPLPVETPGFAPRLMIYLAKGDANSCGSGCDRWIAIEGKIDEDAPARVRRFLQRVKDPALPFYFNSPGGAVRQALAIGRMLRGRHALARIGRTIVVACSDGSQIDEACQRIKASDKELDASIATENAMCNSACGYLFFGATIREVAPDANIGVHNMRITVHFRGPATAAMRSAALSIDRDRIDRETASYITEMGISHGLVDLIRATPFEKPHGLTRQEMYRFGIDRRDVAENAWTFKLEPKPAVRKLIWIKAGDTFRLEAWQFFCGGKDQVRLTIVTQTDPGVSDVKLGIENDAGETVPVSGMANRAGQYRLWSAVIKSAGASSLMETGHLRVAEIATLAGDHQETAHFGVEMSSLGKTWTQFSLACAAGGMIAAPAASVWPPTGVAAPVLTTPKVAP